MSVSAAVMENDFAIAFESAFATWAEAHPQVVSSFTPALIAPRRLAVLGCQSNGGFEASETIGVIEQGRVDLSEPGLHLGSQTADLGPELSTLLSLRDFVG